MEHLPASQDRLDVYRQAQIEDPTCSIVREYCRTGWPERSSIDPQVKLFWEKRGQFTVSQEILLCGTRLVIPASLREERKLHEGHQGIVRSRLRAKTAVWCPGLSRDITNFIEKCPECSRDRTPCKEPLIPTQLPKYPWQKVQHLFTLKELNYIVIADYFSRYPEVI